VDRESAVTRLAGRLTTYRIMLRWFVLLRCERVLRWGWAWSCRLFGYGRCMVCGVRKRWFLERRQAICPECSWMLSGNIRREWKW
jgi:hypothetical protein